MTEEEYTTLCDAINDLRYFEWTPITPIVVADAVRFAGLSEFADTIAEWSQAQVNEFIDNEFIDNDRRLTH